MPTLSDILSTDSSFYIQTAPYAHHTYLQAKQHSDGSLYMYTSGIYQNIHDHKTWQKTKTKALIETGAYDCNTAVPWFNNGGR